MVKKVRRSILALCIVVAVVTTMVVPVAADWPTTNPLPPGTPNKIIWDLFKKVEDQIRALTDKVNSIPPGACTGCTCPTGEIVTGIDSTGKLICWGICPPGYTPCHDSSGITCVDLENDPNNCGSCGAACETGICSLGKCSGSLPVLPPQCKVPPCS
jgi:hypothetical protein